MRNGKYFSVRSKCFNHSRLIVFCEMSCRVMRETLNLRHTETNIFSEIWRLKLLNFHSSKVTHFRRYFGKDGSVFFVTVPVWIGPLWCRQTEVTRTGVRLSFKFFPLWSDWNVVIFGLFSLVIFASFPRSQSTPANSSPGSTALRMSTSPRTGRNVIMFIRNLNKDLNILWFVFYYTQVCKLKCIMYVQ